MNKTISIIIPYFGRVPKCYTPFLSSIKNDLPFSIHIVSDLDFPVDNAGKVVLHRTSFDVLRRKFVKILGPNICLDRPYKLCDFRPLYGLLFPEIVGSCDYWGWGDLDVVYGRIGNWINTHIESSADVISFKKLWLSGSLSILKNRAELICAYKSVPNWESFLVTGATNAFDECLRRWELHSSIGNLDDVSLEPKCLTRYLWGEHRSGRLSVVMSDSAKEGIAPNEVVAFNRDAGRVHSMSSGEEFAYYHSVRENGRWDFRWPVSKDLLSDFFITSEGYWRNEEEITPFRRGMRRSRGFILKCLDAIKRLR